MPGWVGEWESHQINFEVHRSVVRNALIQLYIDGDKVDELRMPAYGRRVLRGQIGGAQVRVVFPDRFKPGGFGLVPRATIGDEVVEMRKEPR